MRHQCKDPRGGRPLSAAARCHVLASSAAPALGPEPSPLLFDCPHAKVPKNAMGKLYAQMRICANLALLCPAHLSVFFCELTDQIAENGELKEAASAESYIYLFSGYNRI